MRNILNFIVNAVVTLLGKFGLTTPNRIAVVFSPLFVSASGFICALVASNVPGAPQLDAGEVTSIFLAGATIAASKLLLWLHGWQQHERLIATAPRPPLT